MWYKLYCLDLRSNSGKACGVPSFTEGLFLVVSSVDSAELASKVPSAIRSAHHLLTDSDGASRLCRTCRQAHSKDFDFNTLPTMIHEVLRERGLYGPLYHRNDSSPVKCKPRAQMGVHTNKYQVIGSSQWVFSLSHTHAAAVVTVFPTFSFAEFSIKECMLCKNKSHRV